MMLSEPLIEQILDRAAGGYEELTRAANGARFCRHPVQLSNIAPEYQWNRLSATYERPSKSDFRGLYFKACGTRRRTRCDACSEIYKGDARHLILAGLLGGKGVSPEVATHPTVFATFTAPSFGRVHKCGSRGGKRIVCGPSSARCVHGRRMGCWRRHGEDDEIVGSPLCDQCYDYEGAVLWNAASSKLWQRTTIYLRRSLAKLLEVRGSDLSKMVRLSYVKVIEYQRRGLVHLHVLLRADSPDDVSMPPDVEVSAVQIEIAIRMAVATAKISLADTESNRVISWGEQIDIRPVDEGDSAKVANYIAKYATKSASDSGGLDRRFRTQREIASVEAPRHLKMMAETAFALGHREVGRDLNLAMWAHDLGHRGHFLTKSRQFSVTFSYLRQIRQLWREAQREELGGTVDQPYNEHEPLYFVGQGWLFAGDAYLVGQQRNEYIEARVLFREQKAEEPQAQGALI